MIRTENLLPKIMYVRHLYNKYVLALKCYPDDVEVFSAALCLTALSCSAAIIHARVIYKEPVSNW